VPIYEFRCQACAERFEALVAAGTELMPCPSCGTEGGERVLSPQAAPMSIVRTPGETRRQERKNAQLRECTKAAFKDRRRRAREAAKRRPPAK
jgi:putative FmdB family regulatory protein